MTKILKKEIKNGIVYKYNGSGGGLNMIESGTTLEIPEEPEVGQMFFNTDDNELIVFDGTNWNKITKTLYKISDDGETITMTYTEGSDSNFVVVYSDDAEEREDGSVNFDKFFGYSAVLLNTAGVETAEVELDDEGNLDITKLGIISGGDNVMIKFPRRGYKISKDGTQVTATLTKKQDAEDEGFVYYAFSRGTFDAPIKKDAFYIGAYEGYFSNGIMKSWSGVEPTCSQTHAGFMAAARKNDNNTGSNGYEYEGFLQRDYLNLLYMFKYHNGDSQATIGNGNCNGSKQNTGTMNSITSATYGTTVNNTTCMKLFGIENYWGNCTEYVGGCYGDGNRHWLVALSNYTADLTNNGYYKDTGIVYPSNSCKQGWSKTAANNMGMFVPVEANGTQYNDRFCGYASRLLSVSGDWASGSRAGTFLFSVYIAASDSYSYHASRLMYL